MEKAVSTEYLGRTTPLRGRDDSCGWFLGSPCRGNFRYLRVRAAETLALKLPYHIRLALIMHTGSWKTRDSERSV